MVGGLLNATKELLLKQIASMTNPRHSEMRNVVEQTDLEDVELGTLQETAENLRRSQSVLRSVTGENSQ